MRERDLREDLKKGIIKNKYLIVSCESLLIDNLIKTMRETLKINEAFDYENISIVETTIEEIIPKLYLTPFASSHRLIIIKNLEEMDSRSLPGVGAAFNDVKTSNIIIMTYLTEKQGKNPIKRLTGIFKDMITIDIDSEKHDIDSWIKARIKRDGMVLPLELQRYLEEEFRHDITGLKNELDKIENYLHEASSLDPQTLKDLAKGLSEVDKYRIVKYFFSGNEKTLAYYREIAPYIEHPAVVVYALSRGLLSSADQRSASGVDRNRLHIMLKDLIGIDRKIKRGSYFSNLLLELLFLHNTSFYKKGVSDGT